MRKYLSARRDIFLIVMILLAVALSTQYFSQYFSSQMYTNRQSPSQPIDLTPMDLPMSPPLIVPTPTPPPSAVTTPAPTIVPTPAPTDQPNDSTITITPSPSATSDPVSTLKLGLYRTNPVQSQQVLQNIDWGQIVAGQETNSQVIYVRNEGNVPLTMSFSPTAWVFHDSAGNPLPQNYSQYFTLKWNYDNSALKVNEARPIVFTLAVSSNLKDVATFSFNLVVTMTSII